MSGTVGHGGMCYDIGAAVGARQPCGIVNRKAAVMTPMLWCMVENHEVQLNMKATAIALAVAAVGA